MGSVRITYIMSACRLLKCEGGEKDSRYPSLPLDLLKEAEVLLAGSPDRIAAEGLLKGDNGQVVESDARGRSL